MENNNFKPFPFERLKQKKEPVKITKEDKKEMVKERLERSIGPLEDAIK